MSTGPKHHAVHSAGTSPFHCETRDREARRVTGYGEDFEDRIGDVTTSPLRLRDTVDAARFLLARQRPGWDTRAMDVTARMARLTGLLHAAETRALRPLDITRQQFEVLLLAQRPLERPTWVRTLARECGISQAAMCQRLQRLEDTGLLERHRAPPDTRNVVVLLTPAGADTVDLCAEAVLATRAAHLECLSLSENRVLDAVLRRWLISYERLHRLTGSAPSRNA